MNYQNILEEVGRQSELKIGEAMQVLSAHTQAKRDTELMMRETARTLSTYAQVGQEVGLMMRETAQILSAHEQTKRDTELMMRETAQILSAHEQTKRDAKIIASALSMVTEEVRQQVELRSFIVNQVLENESRESAKSTTPNVSNYCREWDWELYLLADYYWYYCQQSLFDL